MMQELPQIQRRERPAAIVAQTGFSPSRIVNCVVRFFAEIRDFVWRDFSASYRHIFANVQGGVQCTVIFAHRSQLKEVVVAMDQIALREEIPFERFLFDYGFNNAPLDNSRWIVWQARGIAILHTIEGTVHAAAHLILSLGKSLLEKFGICLGISPFRHDEVMRVQFKGVLYSLKAILNPKAALAQSIYQKVIGIPRDKMEWGTVYRGTRTFWFIGSYDEPKF